MASFFTTVRHPSGSRARLDPSRVFVKLRAKVSQEDRDRILTATGLVLDQNSTHSDPRQVNQGPLAMWLRDSRCQPIASDALDQLRQQFGKQVHWMGPVYELDHVDGPAGAFAIPPGKVRPVPQGQPDDKARSAVAAILERLGVKEPDDVLAPHAIAKAVEAGELPGDVGPAPFELLEQLGEIGIDVECTDAIPLLRPQSASEPPVPPPAYWNDQVQPLVNQLQVGEAWGIETGNSSTTKGDPSVYICVIDTGFTLDHPEFAQDAFGSERALLLYLDPHYPPANPRGVYSGAAAYANGRDHPPGTTPADAHGNAVLSIAAGRRDNIGMCGVAGRCSIFALKTNDVMSGDSVGRCLNAALDAGATHLPLGTRRVILLPGNSEAWKRNRIFLGALAAAANRDDVLIVAPTGNANTSYIEYPTTQDVVMGVGAVDDTDGRARKYGVVISQYLDDPDNLTDADPHNDGHGLSVMAPGVFLTAADLPGDYGYGPGSYIRNGFSGTSAAAAHVAGVAAMLFSRYPILTAAQVRDIIESTADKVGTEPGEPDPYDYDDLTDPSKPRNAKMGYGRVNAFRAMQSAGTMVRR